MAVKKKDNASEEPLKLVTDDRIKIYYNETRKLKELWNWPDNPNKMSKKEAADLKYSLQKYGLMDPLVIEEGNMILGGNHRAGAIFDVMGPEYEVSCTKITGLTHDEKIEVGLLLNKIHGSPDPIQLKSIIDTLEKPDELLNLGFDEEEFKDMDIDLSADWGNESEEELFEAPRDVTPKKPVKCPQCGCEFVPEKEKKNIGKKKFKQDVS